MRKTLTLLIILFSIGNVYGFTLGFFHFGNNKRLSLTTGEVFYVSPTGSDANDGKTLNTAWKTIQHAADTLTAGDTVLVQPGDYNEHLTIFSNSGSAGAPITFKGVGMPRIHYEGDVTAPGNSDAVININQDYIVIDGFKIESNSIRNGITLGTAGSRIRSSKYVTIKNNYIRVVDDNGKAGNVGHGIKTYYFDGNGKSGDHSVINNNTVVADAGGIIMDSDGPINVTVTFNTITAAAGVEDGGGTLDYGIGSYGGLCDGCNVSYNYIDRSGWTALKSSFKNSVLIGNEITDKPCHNAIDYIGTNNLYIDTHLHDFDTSFTGNKQNGWDCSNNAFREAGTPARRDITVKNLVIENTGGNGPQVGGRIPNYLFEGLSISTGATSSGSLPLQVGDVEEDQYPWSTRTTSNMTFVDVDITSDALSNAVSFISLGTATSEDHTDPSAYATDKLTFINTKFSGTYSQPTWEFSTDVAYSSNKHCDATVRVFNSNKDDVAFNKGGSGTFDCEIIFYSYVDVLVLGNDGNPVPGATVTFSSSSGLKPKNIDYKYKGILGVNNYDGETRDLSSVKTDLWGHTPLPYRLATTVALPYKRQSISNTELIKWTITAQKNNVYNAVTTSPSVSWYRPDPNNYTNTVEIPLNIKGTVPPPPTIPVIARPPVKLVISFGGSALDSHLDRVPVDLKDQTVTGIVNIYVYPDDLIQAVGIKRVRYYLTYPNGSRVFWGEQTVAPYDLETSPYFDSTTLDDGSYVVEAEVVYDDGSSETLTSTFTIDNTDSTDGGAGGGGGGGAGGDGTTTSTLASPTTTLPGGVEGEGIDGVTAVLAISALIILIYIVRDM